MDTLFPERKNKWMKFPKRLKNSISGDFDFQNFSFIENPNNTLEQIKKLAVLECQALDIRINFSDRYIEDISSYLVFSEIWPALRNIARGGAMSVPIQRVLIEMGVGTDMNISFGANKLHQIEKNSGKQRPQDIWAMPIQRRRAAPNRRVIRKAEDFLEPQLADKAADRFGKLVNDWLKVAGKGAQLTPEGRGKIKQIYGELLCNAERHSVAGSRDGDWTMGAFMAKRELENGGVGYVCRVAVLSLGQSIADSFGHAPNEVQEYANRYASRHRNRHQSRETLMTLVALQDGVTTDPEAFESEDGGLGLQHAIDFFNDLGADSGVVVDPKMTIVSGRSCIMLKGDYIQGMRPKSDSDAELQPRRLWCNKSNSSSEPPDLEHVFDLKERFSGTLVTMAFTLDLRYLSESLEQDDDGNGDD